MTKPRALLVLPPGALQTASAATRRRLSRGRVSRRPLQGELMQEVLTMLGVTPPDSGLAALRQWGQTGKRVAGWCAAADPVHLETRLHHLRLNALPESLVGESHVHRLFATLQAELGKDSGITFSHVGACGYIQSEQPMAVAAVSAIKAHGAMPDEFTPRGDAAKNFHRLLGELQLLLHDHDVNRERADAGLPVINSLWLWGGGEAPRPPLPSADALPLLVADEPLLTGYWLCHRGAVRPWSREPADWRGQSTAGFVAVAPHAADGDAAGQARDADDDVLRLLRMLAVGRIHSLTIRSADDLQVDLRRSDAFRFWRRMSPLLAAGCGDE